MHGIQAEAERISLEKREQKGKSNCESSTPKREVMKKMETDSSQGCSVKGQ